MLTKSQVQGADVSALLRARNALIIVQTLEEARVALCLDKAAGDAGYSTVRFWACGEGGTNLDGSPTSPGSPDLGETLTAIRTRASGGNERGVWILRDAHKWFDGIIG